MCIPGEVVFVIWLPISQYLVLRMTLCLLIVGSTSRNYRIDGLIAATAGAGENTLSLCTTF